MSNTAAHKLLATLTLAAATLTAMAQDNAYDNFDRYRIGGYGEMVAAFKGYGINRFSGSTEGNDYMRRNTISIPRFVLAGDYRMARRWVLGAEIEFESGGTGIAYEIENTENGEWETDVEKGGEVAIEQFHITYLGARWLNVRVGHMVLPVGLTNAHHEPVNFFGTVRPESETAILPSTWHETGLSVFGRVGGQRSYVSYEAYVTAGLNANGMSRNKWANGASQGLFEQDNFTSPAYTLRLDYNMPGLRIGASAYYCADIGANSDKPNMYAQYGSIPLYVLTADAQWRHRYFTARANIIYGQMDKSDRVNARNNRLGKSPYSTQVPIAHTTLSYGAEAGLNLRRIVRADMPDITPFCRYEHYDPQRSVEGSYTPDPRLKTDMWTAGINWRALPTLVVKADYTTRRIGSGRYHRENELAVGVAFTDWFAKR